MYPYSDARTESQQSHSPSLIEAVTVQNCEVLSLHQPQQDSEQSIPWFCSSPPTPPPLDQAGSHGSRIVCAPAALTRRSPTSPPGSEAASKMSVSQHTNKHLQQHGSTDLLVCNHCPAPIIRDLSGIFELVPRVAAWVCKIAPRQLGLDFIVELLDP